MRTIRWILAGLIVGVVVGGCGTGGGGASEQDLDVRLASPSIEIGGEVGVTAYRGDVVTDAVTWSISSGTLLGSGGDVVVRAPNQPATITIVATGTGGDGETASATLSVTSPSAARIVVTPDAPVLDPDDVPLQLTATVYDASGTPDAGATVGWRSNATSVVTVDSAGRLTAVAEAGTATVTASANGVESTVRVTVAQIRSATARVAPDDVRSVIDDQSEVTLADTSETRNIAPGDVLVSTAGVLAHVDNVSTTPGGDLLLRTRPARLSDAFDRISLTNVGTSSYLSATTLEEGMLVTQQADGQDAKGSFSLGGLTCQDERGASIDVDFEAGAVAFTVTDLTPRFEYFYDRRTNVEEFRAYIEGGIDLDIDPSKLTFDASATASISCFREFSNVSIDVPAFGIPGVISLSGSMTPVIGFDASAEGNATLELIGPGLNAGIRNARAGILYDGVTDSYGTIRDFETYFDMVPPSANFNGEMKATLSPWMGLDGGVTIEVLLANLAGVDLFNPNVYADFGFELASNRFPTDASRTDYTGPIWYSGVRSAAAVKFEISGLLGRALNLLGIEQPRSDPDFEIFSLRLMDNPVPTLTTPRTFIDGPTTFTVTIPSTGFIDDLGLPVADLTGATVELMLFRAGETRGRLIGSATIGTGEVATVSWTPQVADDGPVSVRALLYDASFGRIGLPYPSARLEGLTVDMPGEPPPSGASIDSTVDLAGLPAGDWNVTILYPSALFGATSFTQIGAAAPVARNGNFILDVASITPPPVSLTPRGVPAGATITPDDVQGAAFSMIVFDDANSDASLDSGETLYLLNDPENTFGSGALDLTYVDRAHVISGTSGSSTGAPVTWNVNADAGWGRNIYIDVRGTEIEVRYSNDFAGIVLEPDLAGTASLRAQSDGLGLVPSTFSMPEGGASWE